MPFTLNPEVSATMAGLFGGTARPTPKVGDVEGIRAASAGLQEIIKAKTPDFPGVSTKDFHTKSADGTEVMLRWFTKDGSSATGPGPAVLHMHGGGMIAGSVEGLSPAVKSFVTLTGVPFLSVEYRLAPEVKAPKPLEDCYAGLQYLVAHAKELGVDINRIGILGESAGGGLAACLAHYAKEKGGPGIKKQILIYPMLDDRNTKTDPHIAPFAVWSYEGNATGWGAMLGEEIGKPDVPAIHAAGRMIVEQAKGLPSTYIDVGQLDIFRDEDLDYALKLSRAGVEVEFHVYPGMPHAFEILARESDLTKLAMQQRCKAISSL